MRLQDWENLVFKGFVNQNQPTVVQSKGKSTNWSIWFMMWQILSRRFWCQTVIQSQKFFLLSLNKGFIYMWHTIFSQKQLLERNSFSVTVCSQIHATKVTVECFKGVQFRLKGYVVHVMSFCCAQI